MRLTTRPTRFDALRACYTSRYQGYACITWRSYSESKTRTYDDAINLLNTLQTPYAELKRQWDAGIVRGAEDFQHTQHCFNRLGYVSSDLDKLNIVHVAGTKGKGTVCAYVESILNQYRKSCSSNNAKTYPHPKKVGLYTSPHLISVRERIRINSSPISEALFTKYFFEVWDKICVPDQKGRPPPTPLPVYFRFLTLMSFHVFISESVHAAIYEVGMGGEYDATNIIEKPAVTGISALGIDHTFHLGNTIDSIAWHKSGIFKANVPAYTVEQPLEAMSVLAKRACEAKTDGFFLVKENTLLGNIKIQPNAPFQKQNVSLAIALSKEVLKKLNPEETIAWPNDHLPQEFIHGVENLVSRGRCETKVDDKVIWYLDGAHTADSITIASQWFCSSVQNKPEPRVLVFNQQGHRESMELLEGLFAATEKQLRFDHVIFCPSIPPASSTRKDYINYQTDLEAVAALTMQQKFADRWAELIPHQISRALHAQTKIKVLPNLEEAFSYIQNIQSINPPIEARSEEGKENQEGTGKVRVFITGSIHLVGRALSLLEGVETL